MAKIGFITYGCTLNQSDSEVMKGLLAKAGHEVFEEKDLYAADLFVVNTCTVKSPSENRFWRKLKELKEKGKKVIVAGCVPQADTELLKKELADVSVIGTRHLNDIVHVVVETLEGNTVHLIDIVSQKRLNIPKIRKNAVVEIIPICEGCLGNCSYCKTKHARGELVSYSPDEIVQQAKHAVAEGVKEIWLTAQDTGVYGKDLGDNIALFELVKQVCKIPGEFFVRIGMMNPEFVKDHVDEIIELYKTQEKLFKFIHIPVQSGNNRILKLMNRKYTVEEFKQAVEKIKQAIPDISIATDIICGFPTETEEEFEDSLNLIREIKPAVVNKSRFWLRKETKAAELEQVYGRDIKKRSGKLKEVFENISLEENKKWIGWEGRVIIDEKGKNNTMQARNFAYKQVVVQGNHKIGTLINVKIAKADIYYLIGE